MPFDGVFTNSIVKELSEFVEGKIDKVHQPSKDEIILIIKKDRKNIKLLLSANPSFPRVHITYNSMENPKVPPNFCMVLRKHILGGIIKSVSQVNFDRIIQFEIEGLTELGDTMQYKLICEIMGKHSNILLLNNENIIVDCIKHIGSNMNRYREVIPGADYVMPPVKDKINTLSIQKENMKNMLNKNVDITIESFFTSNFLGISKAFAKQVCYPYESKKISELNNQQIEDITSNFFYYLIKIKNGDYQYIIYYNNSLMADYYVFPLQEYNMLKPEYHSSPSELLDIFYYHRDVKDTLKQKYKDLFKIVSNYQDRNNKKQQIYNDEINEYKNYEQWKIYADILMANQYSIKHSSDNVKLENFYDGSTINIPLDNDLTIIENAQSYYKRYAKEKSSLEVILNQLEEAKHDEDYIKSILFNLKNASDVDTIEDIRNELIDSGIIKKKKIKNKKQKSEPYHFISEDGFDIYVGKNNYQNDYLTLKFAISSDIWMHTKNIPGSHVIIKSKKGQISDEALKEGAMLAAYFSQAQSSSNIPVDYTIKKNVKKPNGAKPGMVIFYTNKTIYVTPDEKTIKNMTLSK